MTELRNWDGINGIFDWRRRAFRIPPMPVVEPHEVRDTTGKGSSCDRTPAGAPARTEGFTQRRDVRNGKAGNGIAQTITFPNGVWERGDEGKINTWRSLRRGVRLL